MILKESIQQLMRGENLSENTCHQLVEELLNPEVNSLQVAACLVLLRTKKETSDELFSLISSLQKKMVSVTLPFPTLDIVGTGGDGAQTINISTGSALLAASCGVKVAKHGNRAVSSLTGSADVLEALGINIHITPLHVKKCIEQVGIGFFYSPHYHPATQALRSLRKQLNVPTTFNFLGPLLNPTRAKHLLLGVADPQLLTLIADVLIKMNTGRSAVVHNQGLDEVSCAGITTIIEIENNRKKSYSINPTDFGFSPCTIDDLRGGDAENNAHRLLDAFRGNQSAVAETLILNAAIALYLYGSHSSVSEAITHAKDNLYSGKVLTVLQQWREISHEQYVE